MRLHAIHTCPLLEQHGQRTIGIDEHHGLEDPEIVGHVYVLDITVQGHRMLMLAGEQAE